MRRIFGLVPNVFFLGLVSLFNDFSAEMVAAVMPAFLISLGALPIFIGFLEGFADAVASVLKIVSGWLSDKLRRRKILAVGGYSLSVLARSALFFAANIWQVFVIRAVDRLGKGFRDSPRDALLAESVEEREVGKSFGYQRAMDTFGGVAGPLAAVALLPFFAGDYRLLFLSAFAVGIFAVVSFAFVRDRAGEARPAAHSETPLSFSPKNFNSPFRHYLAAVFIFGLGAMPVSLMLLKAADIGEIASTIPLMYLVYNVTFAVFALPFGRISDRIGDRTVLAFGFLSAIAAYAVLAVTGGALGIALGFVLFGLYSAMTDGVKRALASKMVARGVLASGEGFLGASVGISSLLAGIVGGWIWTASGPAPAFIYGAIMMGIGLSVFLLWNGNQKGVYSNQAA